MSISNPYVSNMTIQGQPVTLELILESSLEGPKVTSLTIKSNEAITGTTLRGLRLKDLTRQMLERDRVPSSIPLEVAQKIRDSGPTLESLRFVSEIYRNGASAGRPPVREVEVALKVPQRTASYWVKRARESGLLESS